jgi:hypothetical protein
MGDTRKIAAIHAADIVGFGRMTSADEDRTLRGCVVCPLKSIPP